MRMIVLTADFLVNLTVVLIIQYHIIIVIAVVMKTNSMNTRASNFVNVVCYALFQKLNNKPTAIPLALDCG